MKKILLAVPILLSLACATAHVAQHSADTSTTAAFDEGAGGYIPVATQSLIEGQFASRWVSDQALTGALPTTSDTGLSTDAPAFRPYICANAGQTLSGAGSLQVYFIDVSYENLAMRNPALDLPITVTATSCAGAPCQCQMFPDMQGHGAKGIIRLVPSGITVSGGTTVRVGIIAGTR